MADTPDRIAGQMADLIRRSEDDGAAKERDRIIAFLEKAARQEYQSCNEGSYAAYVALGDAVKAIERGEHAGLGQLPS
jgi:hypothetical protein